MNSVQKTAIFLLMIGFEKASRVMALMDNAEIKNILAILNTVSTLSPATQKTVWSEFCRLGYDEQMNPAETLFVIRQVFDDRKMTK